MIFRLLLWTQVLTFVGLGIYFWVVRGDWRPATAQILLAAVQAIVYSGRFA